MCRWLRTSLEDFSWHGAYLKPDKKKVSEFRARYRSLGDGPVIGISWRSGNYKVGARKSLELSALAPMLKLPGAVFVNLQYGNCKDEIESLERDSGVTLYTDDQVNSLKDLDAFAAQVAAMDLVISTSGYTSNDLQQAVRERFGETGSGDFTAGSGARGIDAEVDRFASGDDVGRLGAGIEGGTRFDGN